MRILKIKGKNEEQILAQIEKEYGKQAVVISTGKEKKKGIKGLFEKDQFVVTIAIHEQEDLQVAKNDTMQPREANDLMREIKNQLESMRQEVAEVKQLSKRRTREDGSEENNIFAKIEASLKSEGVHEEVIEKLFYTTTDVESVDGLARVLYENLRKLLPESSKQISPITFFLGSTGVGKTTTIAKLTADYVLNKGKKLALFTADTYRIAAIEQLKTYADILSVPIEIIYSEQELEERLRTWNKTDYVFIDTAGRSHKNTEQIGDMKKLVNVVKYKKVYLVINMNTPYKDVKNIIDTYTSFVEDYEVIITKMDETDEVGNLLNIAAYTNKPIAYVANGQNVPDDIDYFDPDQYIKNLLGRITYE